jgi:ribosomal protein S18 acetylase RimI-like enzyme
MLELQRATDMALVRELLLEYAAETGLDLEFQGFGEEVRTLPGHYDPILIAAWSGQPAGWVALLSIAASTCYMKRLYVRPAFRGKHIGWALAEKIIEAAKELGFRAMRLDTLPTMRSAIAMYESLGFRDIPPYRFNPVEGTRYLELDLTGERPSRRQSPGVSPSDD